MGETVWGGEQLLNLWCPLDMRTEIPNKELGV